MLEKMEECYVEIKENKWGRSKSNDLKMRYVFFCIIEHIFASEKRGMPKLRWIKGILSKQLKYSFIYCLDSIQDINQIDLPQEGTLNITYFKSLPP